MLDGRERYPITLRYPSADRDGVAAIEQVRLTSANGQQVTLHDVAKLDIEDGPVEIKSENARPVAYVYVDLSTGDVGRYLEDAQSVLDKKLKLSPGVTLAWQGQYLAFLEGQSALLAAIVMTLIAVTFLLYIHFHNAKKVALVLLCLPFSVSGGIWLTWLLGYQLSVAVVIGLIALAGVATEFGIVMLLYLGPSASRDPRAAS